MRTSNVQQIKVVGKDVESMFGSIAKRYDMANSFLSMGIHKLWRMRLARYWKELPDEAVLDLCTGTGDVLFDLEKSFSNVIGADFCYPMMEAGKERKSSSFFLQADALKLPFKDESFGLLTVSFGVRNLESLQIGLSEIYRVLKPGGRVLIMEFGQPKNFLWREVFGFYSAHILPIIGGLLTGNRAAYEYLPKTSKAFPCREAFTEVLGEAGFTEAGFESLTGGIAYIYCGDKAT